MKKRVRKSVSAISGLALAFAIPSVAAADDEIVIIDSMVCNSNEILCTVCIYLQNGTPVCWQIPNTYNYGKPIW